MDSKDVADPRGRFSHVLLDRLWFVPLVGLAILVAVRSDLRTRVQAAEPVFAMRGSDRAPDSVPTWEKPTSNGPSTGARAPGRRLSPTTPIQVYQKTCVNCHDNDGRGGVVRDTLPQIPDFTDPKWQDSRTEAELTHSILNGKGKAMRPMKTKLGTVDVKQMVALIRAFRGGKQVVPDEAENSPPPQSPASPVAKPPSPPSAAAPPSNSPIDATASIQDGERLFGRFCQRCHGPDGRGTEMRADVSSIPDFTSGPWQEERSDSTLLVTIQDGKGARMPPFRNRVNDKDIGNLIAFIRTFGPARANHPSSPGDFKRRFQKLEQEMDDLQRQAQKLCPPRAR